MTSYHLTRKERNRLNSAPAVFVPRKNDRELEDEADKVAVNKGK